MDKILTGLGSAAAVAGALGFARYVAEGAGLAERVVTLPGEFSQSWEIMTGSAGVFFFIGMAAFFAYHAIKVR